ncbi:type 1 glutamine amidotransferase-like domain-containing protein [archaeon]|jgi:dipeptidase E|nr:type 1 glutamine amidotransferase-like domain-containing protein [archaeon]
MKLVAIGGGEIGRPGTKIETKKIDQEIIKLTGKKHPRVLFIPTASSDSESYYDVVKKYYGEKLGCKTDALYLLKENYTKKEIENKILNSDIIYVGGGNTLRMLKTWRKLGVDKILEKAAKKDIVLSGISAGAICWMKYGNSDSMRFGPSKNKKLIKLKGLDFVDLMVCPHYNAEKSRQSSLKRMIKKYGGSAIALENRTAIEIIDDKYRIITSSKKAKAYKLYKSNGKVITEEIPLNTKLKPLEELL